MVLFVAQMKGVHAFSPNDGTDPAFAETLRTAAKNGVEIKCMDCIVQPDSMVIDRDVPVIL
jgi:sugar fermentation stimulation protein A